MTRAGPQSMSVTGPLRDSSSPAAAANSSAGPAASWRKCDADRPAFAVSAGIVALDNSQIVAVQQIVAVGLQPRAGGGSFEVGRGAAADFGQRAHKSRGADRAADDFSPTGAEFVFD